MLIISAILFCLLLDSSASVTCHECTPSHLEDEATQLLQTRVQAETESPFKGTILAVLGAAASNQTNLANSSSVSEPSRIPEPSISSKTATASILYLSAVLILLLCIGAYFAPSFHTNDGGFTLGLPALEFLGSFMFVLFTICCKNSVGDWNAAVIGFVYMGLVYATDPVRGGLLNPAITISSFFAKKFTWPDTVKYCLAQLLGSILACFCCCLLWTPQPSSLIPVAPFQWWHVAIAEAVYTGLICLAFLTCASLGAATRSYNSDYCGMAAGFIMIAGGYAVDNISGAHFNPGLSIGMEMVTHDSTGHGFAKAAFQILGACSAGMLFRLLQMGNDKENAEDNYPSPPVRCVCEALGIFTFVLTVYLTAITQVASVLVAFSSAAAVAGMVYSVGNWSGGHFNPAVTLALALSGKTQPGIGCIYVLVQVVAALWAGVLCAPFKIASESVVIPQFWLADCNCPSKLMSLGTSELVFTFALAYTALGTDANIGHRQSIYFAVCTAAVYLAGSIASGQITAGGRMNPALAIGTLAAGFVEAAAKESDYRSLTSTLFPNLPICWLFQLTGAILAAIFYYVTHRSGHFLSQFVSEFVGSYVFAFTVGVCLRFGETGWSYIAVAAIVMAMTCATYRASGGHLNPLVSLTLALSKKIDAVRMLSDWFAHLCASLLAMLGAQGIFHQLPSVGPTYPFLWGHAAVAESMYSFMLCFATATCNNESSMGAYAVAYTFAIAAGGFAVGGISNATCFNPAVAIAIDINQLKIGWSFTWCFFQGLAALLASLSCYVFRRSGWNTPGMPRYSTEIKCLSEFIGVFMLVLTLGISRTTSGLAIAFSAASVLICMNCCLNDVSGAHFNPAVTFAAIICEPAKFTPAIGLQYIVSQLVAGAFAGHAYAAFHAAGRNSDTTYGLEPGPTFSFQIAGAMEFFFTLMFVYVVLASNSAIHGGSVKNHFSGLFGASVYAAGLVSIHGVAGGELNPAACFGVAFANLSHRGSTGPSINFLPFSAWELAGGFVAAVVFHHSRPREKQPIRLEAFT